MNHSSLTLQRVTMYNQMSPRIKTPRKMLNLPVIKGFKPYGPDLAEGNSEAVVLFFEEYEALRLCDYDRYNHQQASVRMGVSRPTFTRVYASALQKIAKGFVEGRPMAIEGGKVYFDSDWYSCTSCHCYFTNPDKENGITGCPLCGDGQIMLCNRSDATTEYLGNSNKE